MRIFLNIEYDGRGYFGWQAQTGLKTIEQELKDAIETITKEQVKLIASGRTDKDVSAKNQIVHFDTDSNINLKKLPFAINAFLSFNIRVKNAIIANENSHARFDSKTKTYSYKMYTSFIQSPLRRNTHLQIRHNIDFEKMKIACQFFVGVHDFKPFCLISTDVKNYVREIYSCELNKNGDEIVLFIKGNGFLHNMVRVIVGTLISIGEHKLEPSEICKIFQNGERKVESKTVPAFALTLENVEYDNIKFDELE